MYRAFIKRLIDLTLTLLGILILSPVILALIVILTIVNRGKPFYTQMRPGKNEVLFKIIKFKTMNDKRDSYGELLADELRMTRFGQAIRSTSLDEIPQLFNVLKGDMSLIGPRPLLIQYLQHYNEEQKKRHWIRPGITGWAQVNGRNTINWEQKFNYDVWYVENLSLLVDCKILWLTVLKVLKPNDILIPGHEGMEPFTGTES